MFIVTVYLFQHLYHETTVHIDIEMYYLFNYDLRNLRTFNLLAINCGDPDYPINGFRQGTIFILGSKVTYGCDNGFRLVGSEMRQCLSTGSWSGHQPTCECMIYIFFKYKICPIFLQVTMFQDDTFTFISAPLHETSLII